MDEIRPIPTFNSEQLELLTQLRERADEREYAYESLMEESQIIMGIGAGLISLHGGDNSGYYRAIPEMLLTLEHRMLGLLDELHELLLEEQMDGWTESWIMQTIG